MRGWLTGPDPWGGTRHSAPEEGGAGGCQLPLAPLCESQERREHVCWGHKVSLCLGGGASVLTSSRCSPSCHLLQMVLGIH